MHICILMYVDDIVLVSENEQKLQTMLDHMVLQMANESQCRQN